MFNTFPHTALRWLSFALLVTSLRAALSLPAIFGEHMVLQRDAVVPVWGFSIPGDRVTVQLSGQIKTAIANEKGAWRVNLDPLPASAKSRELHISSAATKEVKVISDVLVGEVWLGSGQSNMAFPARSADGFEMLRDAADLPKIRHFKEDSTGAEQPQALGKGKWVLCSPTTVGSFSAVLAYFGVELHTRLMGVPVGLVNSSVGGTNIEAWLNPDLQKQRPELKVAFDEEAATYQKFDYKAESEKYKKQLEEWTVLSEKAKAEGKKAPLAPNDMAARTEFRKGPGGLFNGKLHPLAPYALKGIIWYQGEANGATHRGLRYEAQLQALVDQFRSHWEAPELPVVWIQLPNWRKASSWTAIRESQLKALKIPNTGMVVTIDLGNPEDVHPGNKRDVGKRTAAWALSKVYERGTPASGPLLQTYKIVPGALELRFTETSGGLVAKSLPLKGFLVAGADRTWVEAQAVIEGVKVLVRSDEVKEPLAVRYAWGGSPDCGLYNGAGFPASPFRTDEWPLDKNGN